ncbi:MAG: hypothetical protein ACRD4B_02650 [Acidobacteriota bacterium]
MKYGRYGWSHVLLSWGLGAVFLWIGLDILRHPNIWIGFMPQEAPFGLSRQLALQASGVVNVILGVLLLLRWWQKTVALVAALHLLGILVTQGINVVIIRDVGLLGAALALLFWPSSYRKHRLRNLLPWGKKRRGESFDN